MINNTKDKLWPFNKITAVVAIPLIWLVFAICLFLTHRYLNWPDVGSRELVTTIVMASGFVPIALVLLDFLSSRGAILSYKDVKIDFSNIDLSGPEVRREYFDLADNIGVSGPIVTDTSPMNIIETLRQATKHEIVVIDLRDGDTWWVTRLLALSAGAVRAQSPKVFVFIGIKENLDRQFLGLAKPTDVLNAILKSNKEYQLRYKRAMQIAKQVVMYGANEFLPMQSGLHLEIQRYTNNVRFTDLGEAVAEQILMDQLAFKLPQNSLQSISLEEQPERLTAGKLDELFKHCLYLSIIDMGWPNSQKISSFLQSNAPYVALVRGGKFESILRREDGERLIIREVFAQLQLTTKDEKFGGRN